MSLYMLIVLFALFNIVVVFAAANFWKTNPDLIASRTGNNYLHCIAFQKHVKLEGSWQKKGDPHSEMAVVYQTDP